MRSKQRNGRCKDNEERSHELRKCNVAESAIEQPRFILVQKVHDLLPIPIRLPLIPAAEKNELDPNGLLEIKEDQVRTMKVILGRVVRDGSF